ncbi:MAG: alpha-2-macroglobulin [Pseudomonadota bacterium]
MATKTRKFQLCWCVSFLLSVALSVSSWANQEDEEYRFLGLQESGYEMARGETFFLLADSNFSSSDKAVIRLEGSEYQRDRYTGVDIVLYRIPEPLEFLRKQPDLHRIRIPGQYDGEGLANAMNYVWDVWYKKSRLAWQRIFSTEARTKATAQVPLLKQAPPHTYRTIFEDNPQFKPLAGFPVVSRFRYPLNQAKPIEPPQGAKVAGSSHEFIEARQGNVFVPLGQLSPGLYLVEGLLGKFRATALVFVSDTAAITKTSGEQLMVWTADKKTGQPAVTKLLLTDGTGTLQSGTSDLDGIAVFNRSSPERSYLIAQDDGGGVYVSENFYYDSEIHNAKLFAFTDRPLYRPGDVVRFKLVGRHFKDAQQSVPLEAGPIRVTALDASGAPVASTVFHLDPQEGGDGTFKLPDNAPAGGYTLRLVYKDEPYAASFRVARYAKPHYDIDITFDKGKFAAGEEVSGVIRASFPGGQPVVDLALELSLRSQTLAMSDYEHRQRGRFPVTLTQASLVTDGGGEVHFTLPPAQEPSRYTLRVVGSDGSAYRVSALRELLIDPAAPMFTLSAPKQLSQPGEDIAFHLQKQPSPEGRAVAWEAVRLEDQSILQGELKDKEEFTIRFDKAGSYTVQLRDEQNRIAGSLPHWVGGEGLKSAPDTITILLDKEKYRQGETAHALITFPQPVREALLTLERDSVHKHGLLSKGADWLHLTRKTDSQWEAEIPITSIFPPNLTFSVLIMQDGTFLFQNKGIRVEEAAISIAMTPDKGAYRPGDQVTVELFTAIEGKAVAADLAVGVVDEMVYVLQPELAPDIRDFFGHFRRNQVRTVSSLNFHTYDQAINAEDTETAARFNRPVKLLERPRRENIDTAAWFPRLKTGEDGRGRFTFVMPDSLTRWRMTARATTPVGRMGQETSFLLSEKPAYLKWSGPNLFREQDRIEATLLAFNTGDQPLSASLGVHTSSQGDVGDKTITLRPGVNYLSLPFTARANESLQASLAVGGEVVDRLAIPIEVVPVAWPRLESLTVPLVDPVTHLALPEGVREIKVSLAYGADAEWQRVAADLIDYPYGCAEQTASRLIPLSLAYRSMRHLPLDPVMLTKLRDRLAGERFRLAQMAGPEAGFAWWGDQAQGSPFFTAYAYFADHLAFSALGMEAPVEHWMKFLDVYRKGEHEEAPLLRALSLWLAGEMRLPVKTMALGVAEEMLNGAKKAAVWDGNHPRGTSLVLGNTTPAAARYLTLTLLDLLLGAEGGKLSGWPEAVQRAEGELSGKDDVLCQAAALMARAHREKKAVSNKKVADILAGASANAPTIDRALALIFLDRALGSAASQAQPSLKPPWVRRNNLLGGTEWLYPDIGHGEILMESEATLPQGMAANIQYRSYGPAAAKSVVSIKRTLYRLTPAEDRPEPDYWSDEPIIEHLFQATEVGSDEPLDATALYLDEVKLDPGKGRYRYGLLEVPLPPGAELDPFTWGMGVQGVAETEDPVPLPETRAEMKNGSYAVPVGRLGGDGETRRRIFRHLVRFPLRGTMHLPPVRYFSMYNPEEATAKAGATLVVQ